MEPRQRKEVAINLRDASQGRRSGSLGRNSAPSATEHVIEADGSGAEENQSERDRGGGQGQFESWMVGRARQSIVQVNFPDRDAEIDKNRKRGGASEETSQNQ